MLDPINVIHTIDTADGTRTAKSAKCSGRYPKADDFMANSMAKVRRNSPRVTPLHILPVERIWMRLPCSIQSMSSMDPADSTRTAKSAKCSVANRYPKADDFMANGKGLTDIFGIEWFGHDVSDEHLTSGCQVFSCKRLDLGLLARPSYQDFARLVTDFWLASTFMREHRPQAHKYKSTHSTGW
jgi:hypothetical protein